MKKILLLLTVALLPLSLLAQEQRKYEIGAEASFGFSAQNGFNAKNKSNHYSFDVFGGYKFNDSFSAGLGLIYSMFKGREDLPIHFENVFITTEPYSGFRPYVYGRYDFLPHKRWTPYVGAKLGYAFFMNSTVNYYVNPLAVGTGFMYDPVDLSGYEYLRDVDHTLGVKGGVFGILDLGAAVHIGHKGSKLSMGVSMDLQPVKFEYNGHTENRFNFTIGPKIGFIF